MLEKGGGGRAGGGPIWDTLPPLQVVSDWDVSAEGVISGDRLLGGECKPGSSGRTTNPQRHRSLPGMHSIAHWAMAERRDAMLPECRDIP